MCIYRLLNRYREYNNNYITNKTKYKYIPELYTPKSYYMFNVFNEIKVMTIEELRESMKNEYFDIYVFMKSPGYVCNQSLITLIIINNRLDLYIELKKSYPNIIHEELFDYDIPKELLMIEGNPDIYKEFIDNI